MSKTILITGGAASGKSRWAASYFEACDYVLYLCTSDKLDKDTRNRIEFGNKKNMVEWDIKTGVNKHPVEYLTDHKFVIMDNLGSYTSLKISQMCPDISELDEKMKKKIEKSIIEDITEMYDRIAVIDGNIIIITIETGFSVTPQDRSQALFREIVGAVNQRIANMSNSIYLSVSGIQFPIKQ